MMKVSQAFTLSRLNIGLCGGIVAGILCFLPVNGYGQQGQTQTIPPVQSLNSQYIQGVSPGYAPSAGPGLSLNLAPGTAFCSGTVAQYPGGTLALVPSATNYVYLDSSAGCAAATNTAGFPPPSIPIALAVTGSSAITSITDDRTWFSTGTFFTPTRLVWTEFIPGEMTAGTGWDLMTLDQPITVTRLEMTNWGVPDCTVAPTITVTDGVTPITLTLANAMYSTATFSQNYAAGSVLRINTDNGVCSTYPVGMSIHVEYQMQVGSATSPTGRFALNTMSFSSTPTFDASLGNAQRITLTGNVTSSTLVNASAGEFLSFIICQDAVGSRAFAWPANLKRGMTIGATAGTCSAQDFIFDGNNAYALTPGVTNQ
jgi:hypothetical protein